MFTHSLGILFPNAIYILIHTKQIACLSLAVLGMQGIIFLPIAAVVIVSLLMLLWICKRKQTVKEPEANSFEQKNFNTGNTLTSSLQVPYIDEYQFANDIKEVS